MACVHFGDLEPFGPCSACKEAEARKANPPKKRAKPMERTTAKIDPVLSELAAIVAGKMCGQCRTYRDSHGFCAHERAENFEAEEAEILAFAQRHGNAGVAAFSATAAIRQACYRRGRDEPEAISVEASTLVVAKGMENRARFEFPARWPGNEYRGVADPLPV